MPVIHEYTAEVAPSGPGTFRAASEADTGGVGTALTKVGNEITTLGETVEKRIAQSEVTNLSAELSKLHAESATGLDEHLKGADPGDGSISEKFMEGFDQRLDGLADKITTPQARAYFKRASAEMRSHFQMASSHGQALMAGEKAVQDAQATAANYSASLVTDPSAFEKVKEQSAMGIQAMVENKLISQNQGEKLRRQSESEYAKNAIRGWIRLDPGGMKKVLEKPGGNQWDAYLDGDAKVQMMREAEMELSGRRTEAARIKAEAEEARKKQQEATGQTFLGKLYDKGLSADEVLRNPTLDLAQKEHWLKMIETGATAKIHQDPGVFIDTFRKIHSGEIVDEQEIERKLGKGLTFENIGQLRGELQGRRTEAGKVELDLKNNFLDQVVKHQLTRTNPVLGITDPQGDSQYQAFMATFLPAYAEAKKAGKKPQDLLNPQSPDYLGKLVTPFLRSPQQIMQSMSDQFSVPPQTPQLAPAGAKGGPSAAAPSPIPEKKVAEPRRQGEEAKDYLKRIGAD